MNSFNRTQNLNDLFVSLFKPTDSFHWPGNLKKYRLSPSDRDDRRRGPERRRHERERGRRSGHGLLQGLGEELLVAESRRQRRHSRRRRKPDSLRRATASSSRISATRTSPIRAIASPQAIRRSPTRCSARAAAGDPTRDDVLAFINNLDVADANGNNSTTDARDQMGDPLHSQPTTVVYGPTPDNAVVYFATNDGFLHAIDGKTGVEKWAFVPKEFLGTQVLELLDRTCGDEELRDRRQPPRPDQGEQRRHDRSRERKGVPVLRPATRRRLVLRVGRDPARLAAVHVAPRPYEPARRRPDVGPRRYRRGCSISGAGQNASNFVLVLGGGYEPDQDNVTASTDATGNSIYIVDSETGNLLWQGTKTGGTKSFNADRQSDGLLDPGRGQGRRLRRRRLCGSHVRGRHGRTSLAFRRDQRPERREPDHGRRDRAAWRGEPHAAGARRPRRAGSTTRPTSRSSRTRTSTSSTSASARAIARIRCRS